MSSTRKSKCWLAERSSVRTGIGNTGLFSTIGRWWWRGGRRGGSRRSGGGEERRSGIGEEVD
jgi:hypothetical protein